MKLLKKKTDEVYNTEPTSNTLDISYFKSMLAKESEKLTSFCEEWNEKLLNSFITDNQNDDEIPEEKIEKDEIEGQIRATIGKAKILSDRKGRFTQFQVLINNCEFNLGEKKTTCTDLQGFWEMIYFQVEDCMHGFSELSEIEKNGWKNVKSKPIQTQCKSKKIVTKKVTVTNGTKKISIKDKKPSSNIREMMAAKRREMALAKKKELSDQNEPTNTVEPNDHKVSSPISVSATTSESTEKTKDVDNNEEKVFDGGFFSIQSPVSSRKNTPVSATKSNTRGSSTSTPSSQKNTPVQKFVKTLRRSLLIGSASKTLENATMDTKAKTPLAIIRATTAIRRSFSRDEKTPERNSISLNPLTPTNQNPTTLSVPGFDLMSFDSPAPPPPPKSAKKSCTKAHEILGSFFLTPSRRSARLSMSKTPIYKI